MIMYMFIDLLQKGQVETMAYVLPFASLSVYILAFIMIRSYWKNAPIITIDNNTIQVGSTTFYLNEIKEMSLTGKKPFRFIINFPMEGTSILFNDGTEKTFFDDMYLNSWEIKSCLEQKVIDKKEYNPISPYSNNTNPIRYETEEYFKGNQFTSLRGIMLWGLIGFMAFTVIKDWGNPGIGGIIFLVIVAICWFILSSFSMFYFGLTNEYLVVRNHNFTWFTRIYLLGNIKEVVFECPNSKQANTMRIITRDFRNKTYHAGTLSDKTWLDLKEKLEMKGAVVRNECIY